MKTLKQYNQKKPKAPMLVLRTLANVEMENKERACITAFAHRVATYNHFNLFNRMMNLLLVAGQTSKARKYALDYCVENVQPVLRAIVDRNKRMGKLGALSAEIKVLSDFIEFNRKFWLSQPGELFIYACDQIDIFEQELKGEAVQ